MANIRTIVEARWDGEDGKEQKSNYILLHFGLKYDLVNNGAGYFVPVQYTVAIVQDLKTGAIETFMPEQLVVLGTQPKELMK